MWTIQRNKKETLSLNDAKFIFEQAEKKLKDSLETNNLILSRSTTLTTIVSAALITLLGLSVNKIETKSIDAIFIASVGGCVYLLVCIIYISSNIFPTHYKIHGELPINYFDDRFFVGEPKEDVRLLWFYIDAIEQYQERITLNSEINEKRWDTYETSLILVVFIPLVLSLIYIVSKVIIFSFC